MTLPDFLSRNPIDKELHLEDYGADTINSIVTIDLPNLQQ